VRERAAWALGEIGDAQAVERLLALTRDKDWEVRGRAAEALWQIVWKHRMPVRA
jgi:HEAT repeat protein